ncbi:MAG: DNA replication and repair protein RecF, partial [Chloroflexi bacterium]|nr:DNA replication and repair protein RecF [Chloroflexota bacterium]
NPDGQIGLRLTTDIDRSALKADGIRTGFLTRLMALRSEEIARGVTTIGPHRDELRFLTNGIDLGDYGSRGQLRTALLALKMAEMSWMKERTGEWPVILLDEVMAELDLQRRADLLKYVSESEQVLFTATDAKMFTPEFVEKSEVWKVEDGKIQKD